jgi:hypothetical protein
VCIGHANGEVVIVDTRSGEQSRLFQASAAIRDLAITPDGQTIAVATNDGAVWVGTQQGARWLSPGATWVTLATRAHRVALTRDGVLVAVCTDGIVWLWSPLRRTWLCLVNESDPVSVVVSPDDRVAIALDNDGRILSIDLEAARRALEAMHSPLAGRSS